MIFRPDMKTCGDIEDVCTGYPEAKECITNDEGHKGYQKVAYNSGYNHGCLDAKIADETKMYLNQPGKGSSYHTEQFIEGYNDGFNKCAKNSSIKGYFVVQVSVKNIENIDFPGAIYVRVLASNGNNISQSLTHLTFPAHVTITKNFNFKSFDVPVGTKFDVDVTWGDEDGDRRQTGINHPENET